jgi:hypothetical protein
VFTVASVRAEDNITTISLEAGFNRNCRLKGEIIFLRWAKRYLDNLRGILALDTAMNG